VCYNIEVLTKYSNFLRGVPTNRQLTLIILRVGEVHDTPLPPPPSSKPEDADQLADVNINKISLSASRTEVAEAIRPAPSKGSARTKELGDNNPGETQHPHISKLVRFFKRTTAGAVDAKLSLDHVRAKAGEERTKDRVGAFIRPQDLTYAKPDAFKTRFEGKSAWVYLTEGTIPHLLISTQTPGPNGRPDEIDPIFEIPIGNIQMLQRATASVTKPTEKAVEWSSDKELLASLEFDDHSGKTWRLTALPERDELFNRLVAMGGQHWENM
jgi:hypothetical protein